MNSFIFMIIIIFSYDSLADSLYKCPEGGSYKYQATPCNGYLDSQPIQLHEPSPALKEKMRQQELERDWVKQESDKAQAEAAIQERNAQLEEQIKQERLNYYRNLELDRQEAKRDYEEQKAKTEMREKAEHDYLCRQRMLPIDNCWSIPR
jgi:hypothetical protein